jgi:plastocyanin
MVLGLKVSLVNAQSLTINLWDDKKKAIQSAVVYATPNDKKYLAKLQAKYEKNPYTLSIAQRNKRYQPYVSVFQKGTLIRFLNYDRVKHHVYSFSAAKNFELPLYSGVPPKSIRLNKAGVVTLGCNIHDWMLAYALVLDTPFFAKTNAQGKAILKNLPKGDYQLTLWHPQQKRNTAVQKTLNIPTKNSNLSFKMSLKPNWRNLNKKPKKISPKDLYDSYDGLF